MSTPAIHTCRAPSLRAGLVQTGIKAKAETVVIEKRIAAGDQDKESQRLRRAICDLTLDKLILQDAGLGPAGQTQLNLSAPRGYGFAICAQRITPLR